jgi:hypothetical protein
VTESDDAVRGLLQECVLEDIVIRQFAARLRLEGEVVPVELGDGEANSDLGMGYVVSSRHVDYNFTVKVDTKAVEASAEVVARYAMDTDGLTEDVAVHFANRVAFFAAYPYLREVIHTSTSRLPGVSGLVLPVVQDSPGFVRAD